MKQDANFAEFATGHWRTLVRSGVFLGCTEEEAHDLAQTTLLRCYIAWRKVERAENREAYVYRILLNCHRDNRRRRWWGEKPTPVIPEVAGTLDYSEQVATVDAVHRALADLSDASRQVVVLRHFAGLTEQETAEALGIPTGTVKSRLSRALAKLAANPHLTEGTV